MNTIFIIICAIGLCISFYYLIDSIKDIKELKKEYTISTYFHLWNTLIEDKDNITYLGKELTVHYFDYGNRYKVLLFDSGHCGLFNYDMTECVLSMWKENLQQKLSNILKDKIYNN